MTGRHVTLPATLGRSLLAALTTWVTLLAWSRFAEHPAGFLAPLVTACLVVAVVGALLRAARVPAVLVAGGQLLALLLWLDHRIAPGPAWGGWWPTSQSLHALGRALHQAGVAAQSYPSPVPATVPQFYPLLIVTGALAAVVVDLLAVGIRQAPLAGLPLLAAYTAPVSILDGGVSWLKFAAASLCFLFLVAADHGLRLEHWGRRLTPRAGLFDVGRDGLGMGGVWMSARRIGFTATALAVVSPLLVPSFDTQLFGGGPGNGPGNGSSVSLSNPMVDLKRDLVRGADLDLVTVTTDDPDPSYLRLTVLDSFDGVAWRPSSRQIPRTQRADGKDLTVPGLGAGVTSREHPEQLSVARDFKSRWLPTPYPVASVDASGDWRYDATTLDFLSADEGLTTAGLSYRARSLDIRPTVTQLEKSGAAPLSVFTPDTALPDRFPTSIRRLAESVTRGRTSRFDQAVALQQWFRVGGGFRYSLQRSAGNGTDDLLTFLGHGPDSRVGYCEQFAAAMAAMGRALGIPSRVAVGFLHPQRGRRPDTWVFSSHDLHAWPEMYFGGVGWVRFEPTPETRTGSVPSYTSTPQLPQPVPSTGGGAPTSLPVNQRPDLLGDRQVSPGATTSGSSASGGNGGLIAGLCALALLVLAGAPRAVRALVRRRRWDAARDPAAWAEAGWREIRDTALDLGVPWDDRLTLRGTARAVATCFGRPGESGGSGDGSGAGSSRGPRRGPEAAPEAAAALHRLVDLLERARYARSVAADATTLDDVRADVAACSAALRAGAGRRRRLRATWLPASLVPATSSRRQRRRIRAVMPKEAVVDRAV